MAQADDLKMLKDHLDRGDYSQEELKQGLIKSGYDESTANGMIQQASGPSGGSDAGGGFLDRSGLSGIWGALKGIATAPSDPRYAHLGALAPAGAAGDLISRMASGLTQNALTQLGQAGSAATQPTGSNNFLDSLLPAVGNMAQAGKHVVQAIPGGQSVTDLMRDARDQNYPGIVGESLPWQGLTS